MDANLVGQTIQGRYYIVKQLGRGGVGITFLAQDRQCFDAECVVKQLKPKSDNPKTLEVARRLFNREAEILNRLGYCDRIPRLLAYFEYNNDFFLVQELVEGEDLSREIFPHQRWSEAKTITLLKDILEVLLVVQEHSVIHRDIKPSNLMRRQKDDKIVLIDFGSVKQVSTQMIDADGQAKLTVAVGTKSYMPMEQMMGRPGYYSDIYAVGMIAIQALTGVLPKEFPVDQDGEIIWRTQLDSKVHYHPKLLNILDKMLRNLHQKRYSSAATVLADLEKLDSEQNNNKATIIVGSQPKINPEQASSKDSPPEKVNQQFPVNREAYPKGNRNLLPQLKPKPQPKFKFKSKIIITIIGITTSLAAGLGLWRYYPSQNAEAIKLSVYENSDQGFKINFPEAWSQQNRDDFIATGVIFISPLENDTDSFEEQVSISIEKVSADMSLAQYTDESIAEIKKLSDPGVDEAQPITLGEDEARQAVFYGQENGHPVRRMQAWSIKDNRAYVITYTAAPDTYDYYLPVVNKMIKSFKTIPEAKY